MVLLLRRWLCCDSNNSFNRTYGFHLRCYNRRLPAAHWLSRIIYHTWILQCLGLWDYIHKIQCPLRIFCDFSLSKSYGHFLRVKNDFSPFLCHYMSNDDILTLVALSPTLLGMLWYIMALKILVLLSGKTAHSSSALHRLAYYSFRCTVNGFNTPYGPIFQCDYQCSYLTLSQVTSYSNTAQTFGSVTNGRTMVVSHSTFYKSSFQNLLLQSHIA